MRKDNDFYIRSIVAVHGNTSIKTLKKLSKDKVRERDYILSGDLDLCEGCGEWKKVVVRVKHPRIYMWKKKMHLDTVSGYA